MDILTQLQIVDADRIRELWLVVGLLSVSVMGLICVGCLWVRFGVSDKISRFMGLVRRHPFQTCVLTPCVIGLVAYAGTKAPLIVPTRQDCDFKQTTADYRVEGQVEYWWASATTNIDVSLFGGVVTQQLQFIEGQFLYAYDTQTGAASPQPVSDNSFWVRDSETNEWTRAVAASTWMYRGRYAACTANLGGHDPREWRFWFIGPEENLPEVIIEGGVGIVIDQCVVTSSSVSIRFHPDDAELKKSARSYHLQMRRVNSDGILLNWEEIAVLDGIGAAGGTFLVEGFTVNEYREYRIYADKEVSE